MDKHTLVASAQADRHRRELTVLSYNLYLGADLAPVLLAPVPQFEAVLAMTIEQIAATDFPARAGRIAETIAAVGPDVIGVQEAVVWQHVAGDGTRQRADHLQILLDALAAAGAVYRPAAIGPGTPIETERVSFTNRDVILARGDITIKDVQAGHYVTNVVVPSPQLGSVPITRGWAAVDLMVGDTACRFVTTHLDDTVVAVQQAQVVELVQLHKVDQRPLVVVGDFNARPASPTYTTLTAAGFRDAWQQPDRPGNTGCQAEDLRNAESQLDRRIDWIMVRGGVQVRAAWTIGDDPEQRTADGLWPSDHAGVVARLSLHDCG